jgi:hypothetical protein
VITKYLLDPPDCQVVKISKKGFNLVMSNDKYLLRIVFVQSWVTFSMEVVKLVNPIFSCINFKFYLGLKVLLLLLY